MDRWTILVDFAVWSCWAIWFKFEFSVPQYFLDFVVELVYSLIEFLVSQKKFVKF